tara:strand:- start:382 stop:570 length:189 start_codon:yes stop_codon:yes gene_type:complete
MLPTLREASEIDFASRARPHESNGILDVVNVERLGVSEVVTIDLERNSDVIIGRRNVEVICR